MDVELVSWPGERHRRERLRRDRAPRLLLVEVGAAAPEPADCLEDWVRLPASDADIDARRRAVLARARLHEAPAPALDEDGVLRMGDRWVSLPPVEARLAAALIERLGAVVGRDLLARAGWPDAPPGRNALDVHVLRLRRRLAPVGLAIRTVRSRGYLLERVAPSDPRQEHVNQA